MALAHKSLVLLCFLLAIATSQAEVPCIDVCVKSSAVSPTATAHEAVAGCMAKCTLFESQGTMIDALLTPTTKDYNRAEATTVEEEVKFTEGTQAAVVEEGEKLMEEMISLNDQLKRPNCPTTTARNCYTHCRNLGRSHPTCAKLCGCPLTWTEATIVQEEEEKLEEEKITLNDRLKKSNCPTTTARNCYNVCRLSGSSRPTCAKLCGCTLTGTEATIVQEEEEKLEEEKISLNDQLKKSNCPTTTARNCYNVCRLSGSSRPTCAKLCGCTLTGTEAAVEEVEKLKKEMISLNDQLKKSNCPTTTARNCYNVCRLAGTSRPICAKLCGCTLTRKRQLEAKI